MALTPPLSGGLTMATQYLTRHRTDPARLTACAAMGGGTALLGGIVPVVGLAVGLTMQLTHARAASTGKGEHYTDGVVDASAALLGRGLLVGFGGYPLAGRGQAVGDDEALAG